MALPAGVSTATLTVGVPVNFSGAPLKSYISIKPSVSLVHTATGTPLVNLIDRLETTEGAAGQFALPHTDQDGFQDENGNAYKNWYYTATIQYAGARETLPETSKTFQLLVGQTTVDLDLLPSGVPAMPWTGPVAGVTSVNGETGAVVVPATTDADVAAFVVGSGPTGTALSTTYVRPERDQSEVDMPGVNLKLYGQVLANGTAGAYDETAVESPNVFLDPASGRLAMASTAYKGTGAAQEASIGLAYSDDGLTWTKSGQILAGSGIPGAPDEKGCTGVNIMPYDGLYHMFYIGLTALGYEGGEKSICYATATALTGPWTRHGAVITKSGSGWRSTAVWHPNIVQAKGKWWMFFNATGTVSGQAGVERTSYASADSLSGPWTVDDTNAPIIPNAGNITDKLWGGDPFVYREGDHWRMDFARADSAWTPIGDYWATTTDALFPLGWTIRGQATSYAAGQGIKPWVIRKNGQILHYASKSGGAIGIVLSIGLDTTNTRQTIVSPWRFNGVQADGQDSTVLVGDDIRTSTAGGRARLQIGKTTANSELILGQADGRSLVINWNYNATQANATAGIETYAGNNPLNLQNNGGNLLLGGSAGKVGFYGTNPVVKPAVTGAKESDAATSSQLAALTALGLTTDSTTVGVSTKTANYTLTVNDGIIVSNGTSLTMTLPDPTTVPVGRRLRIKNIHATAATVISAGTSKTIDGLASHSIVQWEAQDYFSDGTAWFTLGSPGVLVSPNGTRFRVSIADDGALTTTSL